MRKQSWQILCKRNTRVVFSMYKSLQIDSFLAPFCMGVNVYSMNYVINVSAISNLQDSGVSAEFLLPQIFPIPNFRPKPSFIRILLAFMQFQGKFGPNIKRCDLKKHISWPNGQTTIFLVKIWEIS